MAEFKQNAVISGEKIPEISALSSQVNNRFLQWQPKAWFSRLGISIILIKQDGFPEGQDAWERLGLSVILIQLYPGWRFNLFDGGPSHSCYMGSSSHWWHIGGPLHSCYMGGQSHSCYMWI